MDDSVRFDEHSTWARPGEHVRVTRRPELFDPRKLALVLSVAALVLVVLLVALKVSAHSAIYPVLLNGKYGFINSSGKLVVQPQFDKAAMFSDGFAAVAT